MKLQSINQQQNSYRGMPKNSGGFIAKYPAMIAGLATSSVIAQKMVMSSAEATLGPVMDIGIGKTITKVTKEEDGRTNQSSRVQAIRTFSQTVGGTITGIAIRTACLLGVTALLMKAGEKTGSKVASLINPDGNKNLYQKTQNAEAWGRNIGAVLATGIMVFTNFLIDAPLINVMNKKVTDFIDKKFPPKDKKEAK